MASGDNEKTPVTPKQTHHSFKEINNTALGSYTGAKILPFQKGKRKKKVHPKLPSWCLQKHCRALLCNVSFFTQERVLFKPHFQNYTVA